MKNIKDKISLIFIILIPISFVIAYFYGKNIIQPKYEKYGRYTIGRFDKYSASSRANTFNIYFSFYYKDKVFKGCSPSISGRQFDESFVKKRFIVNFVEDKELSRILLDIPVPDSIKSAPPEGWKELPDWAKKPQK